MKLTMKFYLRLHNISELWEIVFGVVSDNCFRKCKKDCNILKLILVPDCFPLKTEIARFPIGFRLKL